VVVIVRLPLIVSTSVLEVVCGELLESVTVMFTLLVPVVGLLLLITPVLELIEKPAGNPDADHMKGVVPPLAATV
jgi:hypothetical protein